VNEDSNQEKSANASVHEQLFALGISFHQLQDELLTETDAGQGERLKALAAELIALAESHLDQVLGELFLAEHSNYNFTKPLYVAASLVELIRRYNSYNLESAIDTNRRELLVLAALGYNLGLLAYEKQVYDSQEEFSPEDRRKLREHYPQQSAEILKAAGFDQAVLQDVVRNHNVVTGSPSNDALMMRTPFIYAGIAIPQNRGVAQRSIDNPSREFARMFSNQELDPVYGGLYLKINGLAPIGAILNLESNEKVVVVKGPEDDGIASSTVRMLTNHNGVQLRTITILHGPAFHLTICGRNRRLSLSASSLRRSSSSRNSTGHLR
jgi:hypothetical protein